MKVKLVGQVNESEVVKKELKKEDDWDTTKWDYNEFTEEEVEEKMDEARHELLEKLADELECPNCNFCDFGKKGLIKKELYEK